MSIEGGLSPDIINGGIHPGSKSVANRSGAMSKSRMNKKIIAGTVLVATMAASPSWAQAAQGTCDRACLLKTADDYLTALVAHNPAKAPMAPNAKFTEQTKVLKVGEDGLWKSALSISPTFKIPVPDPVSGQIGVILMMKASGAAFPAPPGRGNAPAPDPNAPADIQLA